MDKYVEKLVTEHVSKFAAKYEDLVITAGDHLWRMEQANSEGLYVRERYIALGIAEATSLMFDMDLEDVWNDARQSAGI